jgi:hypothetical protein
MVSGRFIDGTVTGGHSPRVEVSKERTTHDPPLTVKVKLGDGYCEMTTAQWLDFTEKVGGALREEGLLR